MSGEDRYRAMELLQGIGQQHEVHVVVIAGEPPSKARPRFTAKGKPYTPKRTIEGEKRLAAAMSHVGPFPGNVAVACIFYRSSRQRIDVDNLLKAVLDAGTRANLWEDDSQVTALIGVVEYDWERPRAIIGFGRHNGSLTRGVDAMVACESCGTLFFPGGQRRKRARWCSRECRVTEPVPCQWCGEPFKRKSGNQTFCSPACRGHAQRDRSQRRTHCKRGHELVESNVHQLADGRRRCRRCQADNAIAYRAKGAETTLKSQVEVEG